MIVAFVIHRGCDGMVVSIPGAFDSQAWWLLAGRRHPVDSLNDQAGPDWGCAAGHPFQGRSRDDPVRCETLDLCRKFRVQATGQATP